MNDHGDQALLNVDQVTIRFGGIVALDRVSFAVAPGQICSLIGPNGAGKSTLFNCLSRIYDYSEGDISFDGVMLKGLRRHHVPEIGIGRTFQNLAMFRSMTVRENILVGRHSHLRPSIWRTMFNFSAAQREESEAQTKADELLEFLDLTDVAHRVVADLPFGSQKRVELGRALASSPRLLLLDEPACGLNHQELSSLGELIQAIRQRFGVTILLVEHHMGLVMGISDKVVVLNFGRKIAEGTPADVRQHPDVIEAYLGAAHG